MNGGWTVVVPVKRWALAKSRIDGGPDVRERLARAFAHDVVECLSEVPEVEDLVIVSDERGLAVLARRIGAAIVEDHALLSPDPLNRAVARGRSRAVAVRPRSPIVVVPADLPALTVESTRAALERIGRHDRAFVSDASGTGTTLLAAVEPRLLSSRYGPGSTRAHMAAGAHQVLDVDHRVRRDVDTVQHLQEAASLGLGPRTAEVVADLLAPVGSRRSAAVTS